MKKGWQLTIILLAFVFTFNTLSANPNRTYITDATIEEQLDYVINQSSRWEQYKMVLERWLTQLNRNTLDTLNAKNSQIQSLNDSISLQHSQLNALNQDFESTKQTLAQAERDRDAFSFLGMSMHKSFFISLVLIIVFGVLILAGIVFLLYKKNLYSIRKAKEELTTVNENFENYRQEARKKQEDLVIQHHREIQKLKGIG